MEALRRSLDQVSSGKKKTAKVEESEEASVKQVAAAEGRRGQEPGAENERLHEDGDKAVWGN